MERQQKNWERGAETRQVANGMAVWKVKYMKHRRRRLAISRPAVQKPITNKTELSAEEIYKLINRHGNSQRITVQYNLRNIWKPDKHVDK